MKVKYRVDTDPQYRRHNKYWPTASFYVYDITITSHDQLSGQFISKDQKGLSFT